MREKGNAVGKSNDGLKEKEAAVEKSFLKFYAFSESATPLLWRILPQLNLWSCIFSACGTVYLLLAHFSNNFYLSLVDGYDGGTFNMLSTGSFLTCSFVSFMNHLVTSRRMVNLRLGRGRYLVSFNIVSSLLLLLLSVTVAVMCVMAFKSGHLMFRSGLYKNLKFYSSDKNVASSLDAIQRSLHCCGNSNFTEWFTVGWSPEITSEMIGFPKSCCKEKASRKTCSNIVNFREPLTLTPWHEGCSTKLQYMYKTKLVVCTALFVIYAISQISVIFLSKMNVNSLTKHENQVHEDRMKILNNKIKTTKTMRRKAEKLKRGGYEA